jgi:hypothetical protein
VKGMRLQERHMQTVHLKGKQLASFDADLALRFELQLGTERSVDKEKLRIGIRNECGELYRLIGTSNVSEFLMTIDRLQALGFVDEGQRAGKTSRCHAILRPLHPLRPDCPDCSDCQTGASNSMWRESR